MGTEPMCLYTWVHCPLTVPMRYSMYSMDATSDQCRHSSGLCMLLLGEEASPSIGNTLWHVSTMFMRSAITPPEVNGFGGNLGNSEYIVWSWLEQEMTGW